jgi:exodeoxyribonuclease V alpha subunit
MVIGGTVLTVMYRNEDTGYSVLRLSGNITAVGYAPVAAAGAEYKFCGKFTNHSKHGKQFEFDRFEILPPDTDSKVIAFLGGGLVAGVGPATAKKIVDRFGKETLSVMENDPMRLAEIRGISASKALKIGGSYAEIRGMQSVIMWLSKFEMGLNTAIKIYKHYGDAAIEIISKNPYALIETIDGIGFLTADKMAQELNVSYIGSFRVRAGVVYCLKESAETDGDTYLPIPDLIKVVCRLLRIKMDDLVPIFNGVINELCLDRVTVSVEESGVPGIQLTKFFTAEKTIAQKLIMLLRETPVPPAHSFDELIKHYEELHGITFHENQKAAIKTAAESGVCVITGGPGTGKTTIINAVLYINKANELTTQLLAPTGRAAKRIEESIAKENGIEPMTIHRCLDIDFKGSGAFTYDEPNNFIKKDMVIVDEFSMCDCLLTAMLLRKVMPGTKLVLVGDVDQLPSVGAGNVLCDIIKSGAVPVIRLTQIYRTGELSTIATNAYKINNGEMPVLDNKSTDFFFDCADKPADIKDKVITLCTARLPGYLGESNSKVQVLCPMKLGEAGVTNLNRVLQDAMNPPAVDTAEYRCGETVFRVGDRVMHTVNNYKQEWIKHGEKGKGIFNGDIGTVKAINPDAGEVEVELEDGRVSTYLRTDLPALTLSYAITVHKSQGCEFDAVVIPVVSGAYMILTRNLLYTAVTRAKRLVVLVGKEENIKKMVENTYTRKRNSCLGKFLQFFNKDGIY